MSSSVMDVVPMRATISNAGSPCEFDWLQRTKTPNKWVRLPPHEVARLEAAIEAAETPHMVPLSGGRHGSIALLLRSSDAIAAVLLAADLVVVCGSVLLRF